MERTFVMVKPDGVKRRLVGEVISRFERKGLYLVNIRMCVPTEEVLKKHYAALAGKPFFKGLIEYMKSGHVVPMVWEGANAVKAARDLMGSTDPNQAARGTIRGDLAIHIGRNVVHGADSVESAEREIGIWFGDVPSILHFDEKLFYE